MKKSKQKKLEEAGWKVSNVKEFLNLTDEELNAINEKLKVVRGEFRFLIRKEIVEIWMGEPDESESEFVGSFNKSFLPQIIAGLTALRGK